MNAEVGPIILAAQKVSAGYRVDQPIIHGIDLHVRSGEVVTIVGPNGAGKSTFIKSVAGIITPIEGSVTFAGQEVAGWPTHRLCARGLGYVPQTGNVFTSLSIKENLVMGGATLSKQAAARRIETLFSHYPFLGERRNERAGILSGGQRQILAVARALVAEPKLILLDEPTAGLAPRAAMELFEVVTDLVQRGVAVLMVEQNARAALGISDRGYVLTEGRNRIDGAAHYLLQDVEIGKIFLGVKENVNA